MAVLTLGAVLAVAPAPAGDTSLMAGAGVYRYTDGFAWQLSASVPYLKNTRAHYTRWSDNSALAGAYELRFGPFNVSPGAGYLSHSTADIKQRFILHLELGWQLTERLRCQVTHFSSLPHDRGENLALCGIRLQVGLR